VAGLFVPNGNEERPCRGRDTRFRDDPHWRELGNVSEYFCGDNGRGGIISGNGSLSPLWLSHRSSRSSSRSSWVSFARSIAGMATISRRGALATPLR
jgi:hypothetical protein